MVRLRGDVQVDDTGVRREPAVGDMRWEDGVWQRWVGRRWVRAAYSLHPDRLKQPAPFDRDEAVDEASRQRALALAVEDQVALESATFVFEGPRGIVLAYPRSVSHVLHGVVTLLTGGLWAFVWLGVFLGRREDRLRFEVDAWGNVWARPVAHA